MTLKERFDDKWIEHKNGCHIWVAALMDGYGEIWVDGKNKGAHRVSYEMHRGPIPEGLFVCHHCDTPACVNVDHLYVADQKQNMSDAVKRGRISKSSKGAKPTNYEEIKALYNEGPWIPAREVGEIYGISAGHVRNIAEGRYPKENK